MDARRKIFEYIELDDQKLFEQARCRNILPKNRTVDDESFDLFWIKAVEELKEAEMNNYSLKNENVFKKWKKFIDNLPKSLEERVPNIRPKDWHWKMYKTYVPEELRDFRKKRIVFE